MEEEELKQFMYDSQVKIEKILIEKMSGLGISIEDLRANKDKYSPTKTLIDQDDTAMLFEYAVMGISLIYVKYAPGNITALNAAIDEPEYPHKHEWI